MSFLALLPVILSSWMLAAHYLRGSSSWLCALYLALPTVLIVPRSWSARVVQVLLLVGALEWLRIITGLVERRQASGLPWLRMAIILGSATVFTAGSIAAFRLPRLRIRYFGRTA
jgi:hypothetical protein